MNFHFFHIITFLMLVIVATNAETLSPQLYWKSILPNSPMPKAITNLLTSSPMPKVITNLLLSGVDVGIRKGYDDGGAVDVNSEESHFSIIYGKDASKADVGSEESHFPIIYGKTASKADVGSEESHFPIIHSKAASKADVGSEESHFPIIYGKVASKSDVGSEESQFPIIYGKAASKSDVGSEESHFPIIYGKADVGSEESHFPIIYGKTASKVDVSSEESPNPMIYHHDASKADLSSEESPNPRFNSYVVSETQLHAKPNASFFFFEKDLHHETKSIVKFFKTTPNEAKILPREVANSIPFSSNKMEYILNKLNIDKGSKGARNVKNIISDCEDKAIKGEEKLCVTSLESMIDFIISKLGKNVEAVSTEMYKESVFQQYTIITQGVKKLGEKNESFLCHKSSYPYAVFYCHKTDKTNVYSVPLEGADGSSVKAIVVCHTDTSEWNPGHLAFQVLKVKPGTVPVCHLLPYDHVAWISK